MPTLAERRAAVAAMGGQGASGDFIKFRAEGETRILRFLFTDANSIESHKKYWDKEQSKWIIDGEQGSYKITFNCVEYDKGGANPRRVRWELSEYLYNEYLSPYIEREVPASKNVWEIQVRRPGTMEVGYTAFKVDGATEVTYPIPDAAPSNNNAQAPAAAPAAKPTYAAAPQQAPVAQPAPAPAQQPAAPVQQPVQTQYQQPAAAQPAPQAAPATQRKSKYF